MRDLLLLSGGIESSAIAAWLRPALNLTIDYGQRAARAEIQASKQICTELNLVHDVLHVPIPDLGAGTLSPNACAEVSAHPEFWPFRNQFLITLGAMFATKQGCSTIIIGTVRTDIRHRDGSPEFIMAMSRLLSMQEGGITLTTPALNMKTIDLIRKSRIEEGVLAWTHSCHVENLACGSCNGCVKHSSIMQEIGWSR